MVELITLSIASFVGGFLGGLSAKTYTFKSDQLDLSKLAPLEPIKEYQELIDYEKPRKKTSNAKRTRLNGI